MHILIFQDLTLFTYFSCMNSEEVRYLNLTS